MQNSTFARILEQVVAAIPGARGAIFVDWEGEAVDAFSRLSYTGIRLVGAHWGVVYNQLKLAMQRLRLGAPVELVLRFAREQVIIRRVTDDYLALVTLESGADFGRALAVMRWAEALLREEM